MLVKRSNKSGRLSFTLTLTERENVFYGLCNFLQEEGRNISGLALTTESNVMRQLYYLVLNDLVSKKNWQLQSNSEIKILVTSAEGIALMWFLRLHDHNISMLNLKAGLHKQLQR